jgi:hypothetical protein
MFLRQSVSLRTHTEWYSPEDRTLHSEPPREPLIQHINIVTCSPGLQTRVAENGLLLLRQKEYHVIATVVLRNPSVA